MKSSKFKKLNYFSENFLWLFWAGMLWNQKFDSKIKKWLYNIIVFIVIIYSNFIFTTLEFLVFPSILNNVYGLIKTTNIFISHVLGVCKVLLWMKNKNKFKQMMSTLDDPRYQYDITGDFNSTKIFLDAKKESKIMTRTFSINAQMVGIFTCLPFFYRLINDPEYHLRKPGSVASENLPYFCWFPFNINHSKFTFGISLLLVFIGVQCHGNSISSMDTLFASLTNCCAAHFTVLQGAFRTVRERTLHSINYVPMDSSNVLVDSKKVDKAMRMEFIRCIKHLQMVYTMIKNLENFISIFALGQGMATVFFHCTSLYIALTVPIGSSVFTGQIVYLVAITVEFVLYCWSGNKLLTESDKISTSMYYGDWYSSTKKYKKLLVFSMARTIRPTHLTVGKFAPLSLKTFLVVIRNSYSFFAVFRQFQRSQ